MTYMRPMVTGSMEVFENRLIIRGTITSLFASELKRRDLSGLNLNDMIKGIVNARF